MAVEALEIPLAGAGRVVEGLAAGPAEGELVLLLHGFPQDATAFSGVLPLLAADGLRAVAYTQRGYSRRNLPPAPRDYALPRLADDVLAVAGALGAPTVHLVGHDWGAIIGWYLAGHHPERVRTLTAVSVPHPAAYAAALGRSMQALRSAYVPFFRVPALSGPLLAAREGLLLRRLLRGTGLPDDRADAYADRLLSDGELRAALAWYRNAGSALRVPSVRVPTTFVWSDRDVALDRDGAERTGDQVRADYRFAVIPGASHWIPETRPARLAALVAERVGADRAPAAGAGAPPER